jgi:broad specificity phosphatase PhoE
MYFLTAVEPGSTGTGDQLKITTLFRWMGTSDKTQLRQWLSALADRLPQDETATVVVVGHGRPVTLAACTKLREAAESLV